MPLPTWILLRLLYTMEAVRMPPLGWGHASRTSRDDCGPEPARSSCTTGCWASSSIPSWAAWLLSWWSVEKARDLCRLRGMRRLHARLHFRVQALWNQGLQFLSDTLGSDWRSVRQEAWNGVWIIQSRGLITYPKRGIDGLWLRICYPFKLFETLLVGKKIWLITKSGIRGR